MKRLLFLTLLILFSAPAFASFSHVSPLTIDHTKVPNSDQTDFTVLVEVSDNRFRTVANGGHVRSGAGYDIRPHSNSSCSSAMGFELENGTYNSSTGFFRMWVKVASVSHSTDTTF